MEEDRRMNRQQQLHSPEKQRAKKIILREIECDPEKTATEILIVVRAEMPSLEVKPQTFATWVSEVRREMGLPPKTTRGQKRQRPSPSKSEPLKWKDEKVPPPEEPEPEAPDSPVDPFRKGSSEAKRMMAVGENAGPEAVAVSAPHEKQEDNAALRPESQPHDPDEWEPTLGLFFGADTLTARQTDADSDDWQVHFEGVLPGHVLNELIHETWDKILAQQGGRGR